MSDSIVPELDNTRDNPAMEDEGLVEETLLYFADERRVRVLSSFAFFAEGELAPVSLTNFRSQSFSGLEVVGIVGTIHGQEGCFGQCGWFASDQLDWLWARLSDVSKLEVREDVRFRGGELCVWLETAYADYAMVIPHHEYADLWEESLNNMGPRGAAARTGMWPTGGPLPFWWDERWSSSWPFGQPVKPQGPMPRDSDAMEVDDDNEGMRVPTVTRGWLRLGPKGDRSRPGEPMSHLHHLTPWHIEPDTGQLPTPS